jgi:SAM-dependent methyltransferase
MKHVFERIYAHNDWGHGSGEGSLALHVRPYVKFLQRFLSLRRVASVIDFGCGDWQFSQMIRWGDIAYRGYDIVPAVVTANRLRFQTQQVSFHEIGTDFSDLPPADLLIVKDVLQHWSDETVAKFLPVLSRYRCALITNCVNPAGRTKNLPIPDGGFRYIDVRLPPFHVDAREVFSFSNHRPFAKRLFEKPRWEKKVLLVEN